MYILKCNFLKKSKTGITKQLSFKTQHFQRVFITFLNLNCTHIPLFVNVNVPSMIEITSLDVEQVHKA